MSTTHSNIRVYERAGIRPQNISYYLPLMRQSPKKYPYMANQWEVISFPADGYFRWARDVDCLEKAFTSWFYSWLKSEKKWTSFSSVFCRDYKQITRKFLSLKKFNFKDLNSKQLLKIYHETIVLALQHIVYAEYTVDMFDDFFGKLFFEELKKSGRTIPPEDFSSLTQPATFSASAEYQKILLKLVVKGEKIDYDKLISKYSWIKMSWDGSNELTSADIKADLRLIGKKDKNKLVKEWDKVSDNRKEILRTRNSLQKKYNLQPDKWSGWFFLLDNFNIFHDYRKEIQMRTNQIIYPILRLISKKTGVAYDDLMWYVDYEIEGLLGEKKRLSESILLKRRSGWLWFVQSGKIKNFFGNAAQVQLEKLVLSKLEVKNVKSFSGLPASRGNFVGRVFVVKSAAEANKRIKKGEILVTSMTTVDFLPAMQRAGAIITDDGGVTCHAAIVSRELGIPCVVGTKVATHALKNGDKVEVDANHGIIRIVK